MVMQASFRHICILSLPVVLCGFAIDVSASNGLAQERRATASRGSDESEFYRIVSLATSSAPTSSRDQNWRPAAGSVALEVSGLAFLDDERLAVCTRQGDVWFLDGVNSPDPENQLRYHRFARSLHEPLGLLKDGDSLLTVQRTELTRLRDSDGNGIADQYSTVAKGWGVTGNYHEYAYGPKRDGRGNLWVTLNIGMGLKDAQLARTLVENPAGYRQARWRGWGLRISADGKMIPACAGMRSPSGIGANSSGDMFYTDQQGNWVATNALHHMRDGAFYHHPESLASAHLDESPIEVDGLVVPSGLPIAEAIERMPQLKRPAVWLPYKKMGQSATDIMLDASQGKFGPFAGQLFIGEFTQASLHRVCLEKVRGEYQGACFPFRAGFASAVLRMVQGPNGHVFVGLSNRGWSSLGTASYGLQRLEWTGKIPFEIRTMKARPDGFDLEFTRPVDHDSAGDPSSYTMQQYTYLYHSAYGSDEIQRKSLEVADASVSNDGHHVTLRVSGMRESFVHELVAIGVRSRDGESLLHPQAYYTLNAIPYAL